MAREIGGACLFLVTEAPPSVQQRRPSSKSMVSPLGIPRKASISTERSDPSRFEDSILHGGFGLCS